MSVGTTKGTSDDDVPKRKTNARHRLRRRLAIGVVIAAAAFVAALIVWAHLYVDWLWFGEVGLRAVFWKRLLIGAVVAVAFAAAFFAIVYGNLPIARRLAPRYRPVEGVDVIEVVHGTAVRWVGVSAWRRAVRRGHRRVARRQGPGWSSRGRSTACRSGCATRSSTTTCRSTSSRCRRGSTCTGSCSPR